MRAIRENETESGHKESLQTRGITFYVFFYPVVIRVIPHITNLVEEEEEEEAPPGDDP